MCGICGIVYQDRERPPDRGEIGAMTQRLRFRGPDAEGIFTAPGIALGHRRLSVIDLEGGAQPMQDPSGRVTVCFNGEIYNFLELRERLSAEGCRFRTRSDTEVLLAAYLRWGADAIDRLTGMFAFALWDARDDTLLLARDRLGVKPLYWAALPEGGIAFGSELTAVTACRSLAPRLDRAAVARYLAHGYVVGEESIFAGIRRLPPGTMLRWTRDGGPRVHTYWDLAARWAEAPRDSRPAEQIVEDFRERLDIAVRDRLVSDVPLGVFLSGGIDSSTVAALVRRHASRVETFSIAFAEKSYDESPWARTVADALGCRHFCEEVRWDTPELLLEIAAHLDEPFADTSIVPMYVLCKTARARITVALSGDGGDELLAGYVTYGADALHRRVAALPRPLRAFLRRAAGLLPDSRNKVNVLFKAKQFLRGAPLDACDAHASWRMTADGARVGALLADKAPIAHDVLFEPFRRAHARAASLGPLDRSLCVDYATWLADDILTKVDRASMAHGLEVRSPFLDHRLLEFCAGVPERLKFRRGKGKLLLKDAVAGLIPPAVVRRKKEGFNAPVAHWLAGPWLPVAREAFSPAALRTQDVLDPVAVERVFAEHLAGKRDHGYVLFAALMLCLWLAARARDDGRSLPTR